MRTLRLRAWGLGADVGVMAWALVTSIEVGHGSDSDWRVGPLGLGAFGFLGCKSGRGSKSPLGFRRGAFPHLVEVVAAKHLHVAMDERERVRAAARALALYQGRLAKVRAVAPATNPPQERTCG